MKEPVWLDVSAVCDFHLQLLAKFGGIEGIREPSLLDSALNGPKHLYSYGEPDIFDLAASYAHGIVRNHAFLDGNKRTGFVAAYVFLERNGWKILASEAEAAVMTIGLAAGEVQPEGYAEWLRDHTMPLQH
jgi:death-on-curing protein